MNNAALSLVWGGASSGKSALAEDLCRRLSPGKPVAYVATMLDRGEDAAARIARHQARRSLGQFLTVERPCDLEGLTLPPGCDCALVECLGNLLANERYERGFSYKEAVTAACRGILRLREQAEYLVVVGNDVFGDGGAYETETRAYIQAMGRLIQWVGFQAELVVETVCGLPVICKGRELWDRWASC